ncbi:hypothetical protein C8R47DRAFT_1283412 [Mycena vitilis]|nr:hypothetical protein C8R47DRAFT_1283412 [Mycena vitilis]
MPLTRCAVLAHLPALPFPSHVHSTASSALSPSLPSSFIPLIPMPISTTSSGGHWPFIQRTQLRILESTPLSFKRREFPFLEFQATNNVRRPCRTATPKHIGGSCSAPFLPSQRSSSCLTASIGRPTCCTVPTCNLNQTPESVDGRREYGMRFNRQGCDQGSRLTRMAPARMRLRFRRRFNSLSETHSVKKEWSRRITALVGEEEEWVAWVQVRGDDRELERIKSRPDGSTALRVCRAPCRYRTLALQLPLSTQIPLEFYLRPNRDDVGGLAVLVQSVLFLGALARLGAVAVLKTTDLAAIPCSNNVPCNTTEVDVYPSVVSLVGYCCVPYIDQGARGPGACMEANGTLVGDPVARTVHVRRVERSSDATCERNPRTRTPVRRASAAVRYLQVRRTKTPVERTLRATAASRISTMEVGILMADLLPKGGRGGQESAGKQTAPCSMTHVVPTVHVEGILIATSEREHASP